MLFQTPVHFQVPNILQTGLTSPHSKLEVKKVSSFHLSLHDIIFAKENTSLVFLDREHFIHYQ